MRGLADKRPTRRGFSAHAISRQTGSGQMKKHKIAMGIAALFGMTAAPAAFAEVTFNGFGQVMYGQTLDDDAPVLEYDDKGSFAPESLFALQATAPVSDKLDAVAQIVARGKEHYKPEFAWAYARYQIDSDWSVKAGRQRIPFYSNSDYLEVGAAYPYLRPPMSVYNIPLSNYDGVNLGRGFSLGNWELNTQFLYGTFDDTTTTDGQDVKVKLRVLGTAFEAIYNDWLSLRASAFENKVSVDVAQIDQIIAGLIASGNPQTAKEFDAKDEDSYYVGLGVGITQGPLQLNAEYTQSDVKDSYLSKRTGWYLSAAYRLGNLTPVMYYGVSKTGTSTVTADPALVGPELAGAVAAVVASQKSEIAYSSIGLRYNLSATAALKADFTHVDPKVGTAKSADVIAAGIVFSF
jgi:hypothetical protein